MGIDIEIYNPPWDSGPVDDLVVEYQGMYYRMIPIGDGQYSVEDVSDEPALDRLDQPRSPDIIDNDDRQALENALLKAIAATS